MKENESQYIVDLSHLNDEKPNGVSGLLRVKDDEEFLSLSIDSCISALDELIIVYQKSDDDSEHIIYQKQKQYPDKIRVYFYEPEIKSHNLSLEEFKQVSDLEDNSIHLLSNYYNYTLSKASFRYAMKIDADQIYNTAKLKLICDAYRSSSKINITIKEYFVSQLLAILSCLSYRLSTLFNLRLQYRLPDWFAKVYSEYSIKRITNEKCAASFSGINICIVDHQPYLPLGKYSENMFPPFNGIDDHLLFRISDKTYYKPAPMDSTHAAYKLCVIERFTYDEFIYNRIGFPKHLVNCGFLWFHVAPMKQKFRKKQPLIPFETDLNRQVYKPLMTAMFNRSRFWFMLWWNSWRTQPRTVLDQWNNNLELIKRHVNQKSN
ncbi:hypothetical protein EEL50_04020 [Muribaculaceae bacterium Isolate-105 (HZI)]|uniref:hypothetical protein n=1 Tax=Bacteroidales TaxID=171549 RepID=UPI000F48A1AC|nr:MULTISPECIES: hypothetical protein [Bacteroidales]ROT16382.1 hypothetical protein EEL50_04020 [Muribaculaceae bacterium Isolate-105 (HZI)]